MRAAAKSDAGHDLLQMPRAPADAQDNQWTDVDELLKGIEHVHIDDVKHILSSRPPTFLRSKPLDEILSNDPAADKQLARRADSNVVPHTLSEDGCKRSYSSHENKQPEAFPTPHAHSNIDFPRLFKVHPCPNREYCGSIDGFSDCFYYHDETDRRRAAVASYSPFLCYSTREAGVCQMGDRCRYAHNDFERRYHFDRFGKEICRDFRRSVCPRRYCSFRHEGVENSFPHKCFESRINTDKLVRETCRDFLRGDCSRRNCGYVHEVPAKVARAIDAVDGLTDNDLHFVVLKLSDPLGRSLFEKLGSRFGHVRNRGDVKRSDERKLKRVEQGELQKQEQSKLQRNYGWKLDGFNPRGREEQKVKYICARVEVLKQRLREAGEPKWATSLKTSSLRDMMSGARKVSEEIRERSYKNGKFKAEMGPETQALIRTVFSNVNWSCHSQEGNNPFIVTPENQNEAISALERLVDKVVANIGMSASENLTPLAKPDAEW